MTTLPSLLDFCFIFFLLWSLLKGIKKGLGKEFEGLITALLFLGTLLGIYVLSQLTGLIKTTLQMTLLSSGIIISLASFLAALFVIFFLRKKITQFTETKFSKTTSQFGGAMIGTIRASVVVSILVIIFNGVPFGLFQHMLEGSMIARPIVVLADSTKKKPDTITTVPQKPEDPRDLIIGY